ncbi:MAG: hypothetical protein ACFFB3_04655 [Candidatus Hodarchaeota archaeon]
MRSRETFVALAIIMAILQITNSIASPNSVIMSDFSTMTTTAPLILEEEDLRLLIYRDSDSAVLSSSISELIGNLNATFETVTFLDNPSGKTAALSEQLLDPTSQTRLFDAVILLGTSDDISDSDASEALQKFLARGGGVIVAGTAGESAISENMNTFLTNYGIEMGTEDAGIDNLLLPAPYILVRDFAPSYLPFIENVSQIVYHGANVTLDTDRDETEDGLEILFSYPLFYSDNVALATTRETLGTVTELGGGGRLVTLGSSHMFNNTFIKTPDEEASQEILLQGYTENASIDYFDNWIFLRNLITWVSGVSGNMKLSSPYIEGYHIERAQDHVYYKLTMGESIWGTVNLTTWENESLSHARVTIYLRLLETFIRSSAMSEIHPQQYNGTVSSEDIDLERAWLNIGFEARAPGYGRIYLERDEISRVWAIEGRKNPQLPALGMWAVFAVGSLVFFFTVGGIWKLLQEMEKQAEG